MEESQCGLEGKNILVTGGAGFIGSNLVDKLSPKNKVIVLDNLSAGSISNLEKSKGRITFVKGDICDKVFLQAIVDKVEYVFHLAANVGNVKSIEDPTFDMEMNIKGTINLLEACEATTVVEMIVAKLRSKYPAAYSHIP